ncbi:MAG: hypothetical protein KGI29_07150 [Pseudomonadota bacterium]|nr:hypothetical protein [Pseudomonadota bacterium]MDE3036876.1 hypothetical protein [Pseudomonadota bacterium]
MNIQRLNFMEFGSGVTAPGGRAKPFLPTGRSREGVPPPPPPRLFNDEEVKTAEREAYKKGFLEGTQEGKKQSETEQSAANRAIEETLGTFMGAVALIFADYRKTALALRGQMPKLALVIARKVAGPALEQNAPAVIEDVALRACEALTAEPKIAITVHESLGDALERRLQEIALRLPTATHIIIQRDPNMPASDCRIEWQHGGMERDTERLWQQVEKAMGGIAAGEARDMERQMETLKEALRPADQGGGGTEPEEPGIKPNPAQSPGDSRGVSKKE